MFTYVNNFFFPPQKNGIPRKTGKVASLYQNGYCGKHVYEYLPKTGKIICPIYGHGTRATDALPAGAAEGEAGVNLILDLDEGIQHHRAASEKERKWHNLILIFRDKSELNKNPFR